MNDVAVQGNFALGADVLFVNAVPIINIDSPANPVVRALLNFSSFVDADGQGIAADGGYVYLAAVAGSAFTENGTSGSSRLLIGQYIALEDLGGVAPTVSIAEPVAGVSAIEGSPLSIRVAADDDIAVAAVTFLVNGQPAGTDSSEPYETTVTVPPEPGPMVIGARAVDFGNNTASAATVAVTVIADPLTTVIGLVVDANGNPVNGAAVQLLTFSTTTGPVGPSALPTCRPCLDGWPFAQSALVGGQTARGASIPTRSGPGRHDQCRHDYVAARKRIADTDTGFTWHHSIGKRVHCGRHPGHASPRTGILLRRDQSATDGFHRGYPFERQRMLLRN